jgi:hypothetical protein
MALNMKTAAERLLKLADALEKEAHDKTFFVCDQCNHTAALSIINQRRKEASEQLKQVRVASITVNDKVSCPVPGCKGVMSYVATEASERYYMDEDQTPAEVAPPAPPADEIQPPAEEPKKLPPPEGEINPEQIFQPVDEQDKSPAETEELDLSFGPEDTADADKDTERTKTDQDLDLGKSPEDKSLDIPKPEGELPPPEGMPPADSVEAPKPEMPALEVPPAEEAPAEMPTEEAPAEVPTDEAPADEAPAEEKPLDMPIEEAPVGDVPAEEAPLAETPVDEMPAEAPAEETPSEESPLVPLPPGYADEKPSRKRNLELPKKKLPKFEKMPKDASDDFVEAVVRYSL